MVKADASALATGLSRYLSESTLGVFASATVGIAGAGGLGSNVAMLLVRSGVRHIRIADDDVVEPSNLNRQFYWPGDLGCKKVDALKRRLEELEPQCIVEAHDVRLDASAAVSLFSGCAVVVEALDDAAQKAALCSALLAQGHFVVAASGMGGLGGPPMQVRRMGERFLCVGDFATDISSAPPLAPRVMQAAAMQADAVLVQLLQGRTL